MRTTLLPALFALLVTPAALALPDIVPPHSLSPALNGLNIATMVKKDRAKIMLFVINHEKFPVLCDAQYRSGPQKKDTAAIVIAADKADAFKFSYGRSGDDVLLQLICIDPAKQSDSPTDAPTEHEFDTDTPADATP